MPITIDQLVEGANFYSDEFEEKIIITKETPKMVWQVNVNDDSDYERRISKKGLLEYLNACGFRLYP